MANLEDVFREVDGDANGFVAGYFEYLNELINGIDATVVINIINTFLKAGEQGQTIYFLGNGGSAATASHFASDLSMNTQADGNKMIKAVSLVDSVSTLTAVANDTGFENIFLRQLEVLLQPGDVVVGLSVSGNSPNVIKALQYASDQKAITIGFTGFSGGKLKEIAGISLHVPTLNGEYGPVEDIFQILDHLIYSYLRLKRLGRLAH